MAIPVVETTAITDVTSNSTSQSVTLPSGVAEDDIILIILAFDGSPTGFNATGYTQIARSSDPAVTLDFLWKRATASESNPTVNWTGSEQGRITA